MIREVIRTVGRIYIDDESRKLRGVVDYLDSFEGNDAIIETLGERRKATEVIVE